MIFVIVFAWIAYKRAKEHGRSGISWAAITAVAYIGTQLIISFGAGVLIQLGIMYFGWSANALETYSILITIVAVAISIGIAALILRYLNKVPDEPANFIHPPEPPQFG